LLERDAKRNEANEEKKNSGTESLREIQCRRHWLAERFNTSPSLAVFLILSLSPPLHASEKLLIGGSNLQPLEPIRQIKSRRSE